METHPEPPTGAFTVALHSLTWHPDAPNATTIKTRQLWAFVQILVASEQPLERVWFSGDNDNQFTKSLSLTAQSSGQTLAFDYSQSSRLVLLTVDSMEELMQAQLVLTLYSGTTRSRTTDFQLGKTQISLRAVLRGQQQQQRVEILSPGETFVLDLDVQCDVGLADFLLGARVLQVLSPSVVNLPEEWTFSGCVSDDEALAICVSEQNAACYELDIALPRLGAKSDGSAGKLCTPPYQFDVMTLKGGKLTFQPATLKGDTMTAIEDCNNQSTANGELQEEEEPTTSVAPGAWSIRFPETVMLSKLYSEQADNRLIDFIAIEKHVGGILRRSLTDNSNGKAIDTMSAEFSLHLQDLLAPGTTQIISKAPIRGITPVSRTFLERELAGASSDDKKKIQAALAEYDTTVQQAATLTTAAVTAGSRIEAIVEILHTPLVLRPPEALETPTKPLKDLIPPRDLNAESEEQRDVYVDLRTQIRLVVVSLLREYEDVFRVDSNKRTRSNEYEADVPALRDDKKQALIYRLNTQGVYHSFKESLKKRIVPVIRERFARSEVSMNGEDNEGQTQPGEKTVDEKKKEQFGQISTLLMQEVNAILHDTFYSDSNALLERTLAISESIPTLKEVTSVLEVLRLKTVENEASGDVEKSEMLHLDRIAYAEQHATRMQAQHSLQENGDPDTSRPSLLLMNAWYEYARFCVGQAKLEKAGAAFQQCLRLDTHAIHALVALVAVQCELHDFARTELLAKSAVHEAQNLMQSNNKYSVLAHALLAFFFSEFEGKDPTRNLTMFELHKAQEVLQRDTTITDRKEPTCESAVWIVLAQYAYECQLWRLSQRSLELADKHLKVRDVISGELRVMKRAIEAELAIRDSEGDENSRTIRAIKLLQEALEINPSHPFAWFALGKVYLRGDTQTNAAIECLQRALEHRVSLPAESFRLGLFLRLGLALLNSSQFESAEATFLLACDEFRVASCWLGVGIACLRLERWDRAQAALAEANRLDASNPDVWGYLALLALTAHAPVTIRDEMHAQHFVTQALRHNLSNPALLRELSNAFVAIDRLESAEKLLRRSLACQDSSLTRKTLADVLAAQNFAEDALRQYTQSLDVTEDAGERCALLEKCAQLLITLGRPEVASEYRMMATQFQVNTTDINGKDG